MSFCLLYIFHLPIQLRLHMKTTSKRKDFNVNFHNLTVRIISKKRMKKFIKHAKKKKLY